MATRGGPPTIVTPEGVVLDLAPAGLASRVLAILIDLSVQLMTVGFLISILAAGAGAAGGEAAFVIVLVVGATAVLLGYPIVLESTWQGRTLGKAALGLRVLTVEGGPIGARHALIRGFLLLVDLYLVPIGVIAVASVLAAGRRQRLGDLVAGTIVVKDAAPARGSFAVRFPAPPGLEGYVATLDTSPLTARQYGVVRSFLLRVEELDPAARGSMAWSLAQRVERRLGVPRHESVHPEAFLACVAAAHQQRTGGL